MNAFGIKQVDAELIKLNSCILSSRQISLGDGEMPITTRFGKWDMKNKKVNDPIHIKDWIIIWLHYDDRNFDRVKNAFYENMEKCFANKGIKCDRPKIMNARGKNVEDLFKELRVKMPTVSLAFFFIGNQEMYDSIKKCEEKYGIMTQCASYEKFAEQIQNDAKLESYLSNLAM